VGLMTVYYQYILYRRAVKPYKINSPANRENATYATDATDGFIMIGRTIVGK